MKTKMMMVALIAAGFMSVSFVAQAKHHEGKWHHHAHACWQIVKVCKTAGFHKHGHKKEKKGLYVDCMKPILEGKSVSGVSVDSKKVEECKEARKHWREHHHHYHHHKKGDNDSEHDHDRD